MFDFKKLAKAVTTKRTELELGVRGAAEVIGMDKSSLSSIENGQYKAMQTELLARLLHWLKKTPNDFWLTSIKPDAKPAKKAAKKAAKKTKSVKAKK